MQFTYRGTSYEVDIPALDMQTGEIGGRYRGATWHFRFPRHIPVPQPSLDLKYRGIAYTTHRIASITDLGRAPVTTAEAPKPKPVATTSYRLKLNEIEQVHRNNIRRSAERRLLAAQARGDQRLIQAIEAELSSVS